MRTWIIASLLTLSLTACGKKLDKDQCQKLVDHAVDLAIKQQGGDSIPADVLKQAKAAAASQLGPMLEQCQKELTQGQYDCAMKATSMADIEKCDE